MKTNREKVPQAFIALGKNRQKIYGNDTVYLKKGQEFQLEFSNPCKYTVMAKITINGNLISDRGLIIRPGDRGYLERYIDEDRKFLFDVYTVNNNQETREAIEDNGDLKVEFYKEKVKKQNINFNLNYVVTDNIYTSKLSDRYDSNTPTYSIDNAPDEKYRGIATMDFMDMGQERSLSSKSMKSKRSKKVETGRVEKGNESGQRFNEVNLDFNPFPFHTVTYKLLPFSRQPQELKGVKTRCVNCNTKIKSGWKVCPVCATPIGTSGICSCCSAEVEANWKVCPMCGTDL